MSLMFRCVLFLVCVLFAGAKIGAAQSSASVSPHPPPADRAAPRAAISPEYKVGNGDVLEVSVWGEPQLSKTVTVRPDGKISLPLVDEIVVTGMSTNQIQADLNQRFEQYIRHPQASVLVSEIHSKLVYVTGEVQRPGAYPVASSITVVQLIARAGGTTAFAKQKKIYVLRQAGGKRMNVDYKAVLQGRHENENVELLPGDTVVVP